MATIKLINEDEMAKNKSNNKRRKPTNQDFVNAITNLIKDNESLRYDIDIIGSSFNMYLKYRETEPGFKKYIDKLVEESNSKNNESEKTEQDNTITTEPNPTN